MRVVVTGGAGFIGRHVVAELVARRHDLLVLDSLRPDVHRDGGRSARSCLSRLRAPLVVGDVRDPDRVSSVLAGADALVHLAAKVGLGVDVADMDDYVSSNDLGTAVLLRVAARAGLSRVVQASSMVVYGEGRYECEAHGVISAGPRHREALEAGRFEPPCPICGATLAPGLVGEDARLDPRNTYAATKVAQEHLAEVWTRETGGVALSLRLHNVYGPGMPRDTPYAGVASIFSSALDRGEAPRVFEDGAQRRDFVHVTDVAGAFADALDATAAAGTGAPGRGTPGTGTPGTSAPGTGTPGTGTPGRGTPGTGAPGTGTPGTGTPGTGAPGTGTPGTGAPGRGTPGRGTPHLGGWHRAYNVGSGVVSTIGDLARALSSARGGPEPVVTGEFRMGDVRHVTASSRRIADEIGWRAAISLADGVRELSFSR